VKNFTFKILTRATARVAGQIKFRLIITLNNNIITI
jgi:hypothetical protein